MQGSDENDVRSGIRNFRVWNGRRETPTSRDVSKGGGLFFC